MKKGNPVLLVFREVLVGDVKKVHARSNISNTGGGARDLRFRDADIFFPILSQFFTFTNGSKVGKAKVHWESENGIIQSTILEFWPATNSRPNEMRFARIHTVKGWEVDQQVFNSVTSKGDTLFFYLILDDLSNVWARLFDSQYLNQETTIVKNYIHIKLTKKTKNAIFGSIDFRTLLTFP